MKLYSGPWERLYSPSGCLVVSGKTPELGARMKGRCLTYWSNGLILAVGWDLGWGWTTLSTLSGLPCGMAASSRVS